MKQSIEFRDLGVLDYKAAWDYQEALLQQNISIKQNPEYESFRQSPSGRFDLPTINYLLFVEHPPVFTLGKSGHMEHVLLDEQQRKEKGIEFFQTNRGGDITFHV